MEYEIDIIADAQNRAMEVIQSSEDLEFIWHMRLAEIERQMTNEPVRGLYILMFKYGAKVTSRNIRNNEYEINLLFQWLDERSYSFIIKPNSYRKAQ